MRNSKSSRLSALPENAPPGRYFFSKGYSSIGYFRPEGIPPHRLPPAWRCAPDMFLPYPPFLRLVFPLSAFSLSGGFLSESFYPVSSEACALSCSTVPARTASVPLPPPPRKPHIAISLPSFFQAFHLMLQHFGHSQSSPHPRRQYSHREASFSPRFSCRGIRRRFLSGAAGATVAFHQSFGRCRRCHPWIRRLPAAPPNQSGLQSNALQAVSQKPEAL